MMRADGTSEWDLSDRDQLEDMVRVLDKIRFLMTQVGVPCCSESSSGVGAN